jgi:hypothetical protein
MKITENKIYFSFVLLGLFYFVTKITFYILDVCGTTALMLGLLATVLTILIGIASFKEYSKKANKLVAHWLAIIGPLFILIYTPIYMTTKMGIPVFQFSTGKFIILVIFECLAIAQLILSILMFKGVREKNKS